MHAGELFCGWALHWGVRSGTAEQTGGPGGKPKRGLGLGSVTVCCVDRYVCFCVHDIDVA